MTRVRLKFPRLLPFVASLLAVAGALNGPPLRADEKALPSDLALVPRDAAGFVTIRVSDLLEGAAGKEFLQQLRKDKEGTDAPLADLKRELLVPPGDVERLTFVPEMQVVIVRTTRAYDRDKMLDALGGEAKVQRYKGKTVYVGGDLRGLAPIDENVFLCGPAGALEKLLDAPAAPAGPSALDEALELAAGKHHVTAGVNPLAVLRDRMRRYDEVEAPKSVTAPAPSPSVPVPVPPPGPPPDNPVPSPPPFEKPKAPPPGGGALAEPGDPVNPDREPDAQELLKGLRPEELPFKPLLQARSVALTFDVDEGARLEVRVAYADKDLVADGETAVKTTLYVLRELLPRAAEDLSVDADAGKQLRPVLRQLQDALRTAVVRSEGTTVIVSAQTKVDPGTFAAMALQLRRGGESAQSSNNLKQIALAMMNFHDTYGFMPPPAICGRDGKPLLSWRVAILPFIEQQPLYLQFKLDEPWDGPNNKKLLALMPKIYAPVRGKTKQPYSTYYQVFVGPAAPFQIRPGGNGPFGAVGPSIPATFTDGTSNTLLVVEAGEAVPWTKPEDIPFDEKKPVPPLGGDFGFGFHAAMADGSVLFIRKDIDEKLLKLLIMPADGNPIDYNKVPVIGPGRP